MAEVRRHWYVLFAETLGLFILALMPILVIVIFDVFDLATLPNFIPLTLFGSGLWFLAIWIIFFIVWTDYYLDVWVITSKRIIDIEQRNLFSRSTSECRIEKIQDVSVEVHGFLATFLRFGNVKIQTAGESGNFTLKSVPDPHRVKDIIFKEQERQAGESRRGGQVVSSPLSSGVV